MKKNLILLTLTLTSLSLLSAPIRSALGSKEYLDVSAPLPHGAIAVEYIQGDGTQWIDLGIYGTENTIAQIGVMPTRFTSSVLFGIYYANGNLFNFFVRGYGLTYFQIKNSTISTRSFGGTNIRLDIELGNNYVGDLQTGEVVFSGMPVTSFKTDRTIKWFYYDRGGYVTGQGRIYYTKIFEDGFLTLDFIPVRFSNDHGEWEGALLDLVSGDLYRNQGTGSFILGPDL